MRGIDIRVAFFTHYTALYGANRSLLNLIEGLEPLGVLPLVVVPQEGDLTAVLRRRGVPFLVFPLEPWSDPILATSGIRCRIAGFLRRRMDALLRLSTNCRLAPRVARCLKDAGVDIVYSNSSVLPLGAMVALLLRKPHIWHLREFGDLDYNLAFDWGRTLSYLLIRRSFAQICVSKAVCAHHASGLRPDRFFVVYNGVATQADMDRLRELCKKRSDKDDFTFALVGVIHPNKGQRTAILALSLLKDSCPGIKLIIAGGGDGDGALAKLANECGVSERVMFWGYAESPYDVFSQSDATLMCSEHEAMGRVTVESMAAGKPVIGFDAAGTAELIVDGVNGLLYAGAEKELALCMRRLAENPGWAREMGQNGRHLAAERYTCEVYAAQIHSVLTSAMQSQR